MYFRSVVGCIVAAVSTSAAVSQPSQPISLTCIVKIGKTVVHDKWTLFAERETAYRGRLESSKPVEQVHAYFLPSSVIGRDSVGGYSINRATLAYEFEPFPVTKPATTYRGKCELDAPNKF